MSAEEIPVIDAEAYIEKREGWEEECKKVAYSFHKFGILKFKDPRVKMEDNSQYIDLVERYFDWVSKKYYAGEEIRDSRPDLCYQTGVTPEGIEKARDHQKLVESLTGEDKPLSVMPPAKDAKWRFFWKIGERPAEVKDDIPQITPEEFADWEPQMDKWGTQMIDACFLAAEMAAVGMGLDKDTFTQRMKGGPHLLAPTASDLIKYPVGTAFASFHYDLNFITIHGKSRYPGLFLWTREWKKQPVKIPDGCLLLQAGIMFEQITGGYVMAGYHEVVYTDSTKEVVDKKLEENKNGGNNILWRISSTLFSHLRYDVDLSPIEDIKHLHNAENVASGKYPKMTAHDKLMEELKAINLAPKIEIQS
uniref:Clavaminate synthase-like protein n=1 Tax=Strombidium rassoulzadegani TaxID=1082188 RepID=A0A7S3CMU6_9SPIT|mmetsp:Transcript_17540/g.29590  ORF Transcript_17540/g.29590 Transcript_17540/m.29590 type:complete len:363 (+) Transcript_17540:33-1121(+)